MKDKKKTNVIYQFITDIIMKKLQKQKKKRFKTSSQTQEHKAQKYIRYSYGFNIAFNYDYVRFT